MYITPCRTSPCVCVCVCVCACVWGRRGGGGIGGVYLCVCVCNAKLSLQFWTNRSDILKQQAPGLRFNN